MNLNVITVAFTDVATFAALLAMISLALLWLRALGAVGERSWAPPSTTATLLALVAAADRGRVYGSRPNGLRRDITVRPVLHVVLVFEIFVFLSRGDVLWVDQDDGSVHETHRPGLTLGVSVTVLRTKGA